MGEMERKFPGNREQSLFASVELSLRRMSPENRERARVLGVFHGGVQLGMLLGMTEWETAEVASLAAELIETGLATPGSYDHLTLNPALCHYLRGRLDAAERESLMESWADAMRGYTNFLYQQRSQKAEIAATLTLLELPNLFALLDHVQHAGDAEATVGLTTSLYTLLQTLGKSRLLERVARARDDAAAALGQTWNHAQFEAQRTRIEQQLDASRLREALDGAQELLRRARQAGDTAYPNAAYDLAMGCNLLGQVLMAAGGPDRGLPFLDEALGRFENIPEERAGNAAKRMVSTCHTRRGDCLLALGRLDEAAAAYEEGIRRDEDLGAERDIAVGESQLGVVRLQQRRYKEALQACEKAREQFTRLDEPRSVAVSWHQIGLVYQQAGQPEAAEDAYRESLAINVRLGNVLEQAGTLLQLGNLYDLLGRSEEAVGLCRQAADKYGELGDVASEGRARNNLGDVLRRLRCFEEARQEIRRAIECKAQFGHASEPWTTWNILNEIETADGNPVAAAEAERSAVECYLAYRRDGGENHYSDGRICVTVTQSLLTRDPAAATSFLQQLSTDTNLPPVLRPFIQALQAIVAGSRDRTLADSPDLYYTSAAEILLLIETLERPQLLAE
jgi:tetratricopeptide (TPR) repeat protein